MKTIAVEIQVPDHLRWITIDKDGSVRGWSLKPKKIRDRWIAYGYRKLLADTCKEYSAWETSLVDLTHVRTGNESLPIGEASCF